MGIETHYKEAYLEAMAELKDENPLQSVLLPTVTQRTGEGVVAHYDNSGPRSDLRADLFNTAKSWTGVKDKRTRQKQEALVLADDTTYDTFAEWQKTRTPHEEINRQRTLFFYRLLEWGFSFDHTMDTLEFTSPKSKILRQGYRKLQAGKDALIIQSIKAPNVSRVTTGHDTATNVALAAGQQINSAVNDKFTLEDITSVMELYDNVLNTEKVYILISPKSKKSLIDTDANKINNQDFVSSYEHFAQGTLPDIYGAHIIPHPYIADDEFLAYTESSLVFMNFGQEINKIDESPDERFQTVAFMEKGADAKRVDDQGVVIGTITSA